MIRLDVEQGSPEWFTARRGIPTASAFDRIITSTGKKSGQWDKYAHQLLAERLLGRPVEDGSSAFMERGRDLEADAVAFYEMHRECDTEPGGFCLRDDMRAGCSPDRIVGADGLLEIKCPSITVHMGYLLDPEGIGYKVQVQGQLWVCEREWSDTLSYHPSLPRALVRQARDEKFIAAIASLVDEFNAYLDAQQEKLAAAGHLPVPA